MIAECLSMGPVDADAYAVPALGFTSYHGLALAFVHAIAHDLQKKGLVLVDRKAAYDVIYAALKKHYSVNEVLIRSRTDYFRMRFQCE